MAKQEEAKLDIRRCSNKADSNGDVTPEEIGRQIRWYGVWIWMLLQEYVGDFWTEAVAI